MDALRLVVLFVAVVAAIAAAVLTRSILSNSRTTVAPVVEAAPAPTVEVLVVTESVVRGERLENKITWRSWPKEHVSPDYVLQSENPDALETFTEAVAIGAIAGREPVTDAKVVFTNSTAYLSAMLTPGKVAFAVSISPTKASGGFILPDDRVDIISTQAEAIGDDEEMVATTVLSNVRVLAIDTYAKFEGQGGVIEGRTATLEVTPQQATALAEVQANSGLTLVLRSLEDSDEAFDDASNIGAKTRMRVMKYGRVSAATVEAQ